jgi:hypothetical protein
MVPCNDAALFLLQLLQTQCVKIATVNHNEVTYSTESGRGFGKKKNHRIRVQMSEILSEMDILKGEGRESDWQQGFV